MIPLWVKNRGEQITESATFRWLAQDAGSGAVDLTLLKGTGSATFTRAGATATTVLSTGLVSSAIAANTARSYYDPTTLTYLGYLAEEARTNLCLRSQEFDNASWTKANITVTADTADTTSPDGSNNAELLTESTDGGVTAHQVTQAITVSNTTVYTASVWLKAAVRTQFRVFISNATTIAAGLFDLQAGTVGSVTGSATIKAYPNGWYRCTVTGTTDSTTSTIFIMPKSGGSDYTGNGSKAGYVYGAQLEAGAFATSYIPTAAATSTRAADVLTIPSAGNVLGSAGSLFARVTGFTRADNATASFVNCGASSVLLYGLTPSSNLLRMYDGTTIVSGALTWADGVTRRMASRWGASGGAVFSNGSTIGSSGTAISHTIGANINIGDASGGMTTGINGCIRDIRIWQRVLSDSEVQAL